MRRMPWQALAIGGLVALPAGAQEIATVPVAAPPSVVIAPRATAPAPADPGVFGWRRRHAERKRHLQESFLGFPEEFNSLREPVGNIHGCAVLPELRVVPFGRFVMKDDEVADAFIFVGRLAVEFGRDCRVTLAPRKHFEKSGQRRLDQVDGGRFQRL